MLFGFTGAKKYVGFRSTFKSNLLLGLRGGRLTLHIQITTKEDQIYAPLSPLSFVLRTQYNSLGAAHFEGFPLYSEALSWDVRKSSQYWQHWQLPQPV